LAKRYLSTGEPPSVLEGYLGAYTKDEFDFGSDGKYSAAEFDPKKSLFKGSVKSCFLFLQRSLAYMTFIAFTTFIFQKKKKKKIIIIAIITNFGLESSLLFVAVALKKRIAVFCSQPPILSEIIRTLPLFAWHRKNWSLLRPFVTLSDVEIEELSSTGIYVAGFTDKSIAAREDLFDLLVDGCFSSPLS